MTDHIKLQLPVPVTINHAYANAGKGRVKTPVTKRWQVQAQHHMVTCPEIKALAAYRAGVQQIRAGATKIMGKKVKVSIYDLRNMFKKRYRIEYRFYFPDDGLRDVANFEKLLTDFLVEHGFLVDDQFIDDMRLLRAGVSPVKPRVEIDIFSIDPPTP